MKNETLELGWWLQRFFCEYLSAQRNVSHATIAAYRDTFQLLLRYLRKTNRTPCHALALDVLTPDSVVRFLDYLEGQRGNAIPTRKARLAAIRAFVHYLSDWLGPELPAGVPRILTIPRKRSVQPLIGFLTRPEVEAILSVTGDTWTGRRNYLLFLLLYNTGARISEILALRAKDLSTGCGQVEVLGRVQKLIPIMMRVEGVVPLWKDEVSLEAEGAHLVVGDLVSSVVVFRHQTAADA